MGWARYSTPPEGGHVRWNIVWCHPEWGHVPCEIAWATRRKLLAVIASMCMRFPPICCDNWPKSRTLVPKSTECYWDVNLILCCCCDTVTRSFVKFIYIWNYLRTMSIQYLSVCCTAYTGPGIVSCFVLSCPKYIYFLKRSYWLTSCAFWIHSCSCHCLVCSLLFVPFTSVWQRLTISPTIFIQLIKQHSSTTWWLVLMYRLAKRRWKPPRQKTDKLNALHDTLCTPYFSQLRGTYFGEWDLTSH